MEDDQFVSKRKDTGLKILEAQKLVENFAHKIKLNLNVFFYTNMPKNTVIDQFKLLSLIKESTFSFVYQVR